MAGRFAWIIDGATGVVRRQINSGGSDAEWLARTIDWHLKELAATEGTVGFVLAALEKAVAEAFATQTKTAPPSTDLGPAACLGVVALVDDPQGLILRGAFLGDVVALVPTRTGVVRWTDERAKPFENCTLATLDGTQQPGSLPEPARLQIVENRRQLNRVGGYWVVQPERPWAGRELTFETVIEPNRPVALATDGFMRLVDVFGTFTDATLYAALAEGHRTDLIAELRDLEGRDDVAGAGPRVKKHDDATVLVLVVDE